MVRELKYAPILVFCTSSGKVSLKLILCSLVTDKKKKYKYVILLCKLNNIFTFYYYFLLNCTVNGMEDFLEGCAHVFSAHKA